MLASLRTRLAAHWKAAKDSLLLLGRQPIASAMTVISIASILTLPAIFLELTDNVGYWTSKWQKDEHISLYLKPDLSLDQQMVVLKQVQALPLVEHATLKTPQEGLQELSLQEGMQDVMHDLSQNPLPAVIEITPHVFHSDEARQQFYTTLQGLNLVEQVKMDMQWLKRIEAILSFLAAMAHGLMLLLAFAVIFIIANTLRQTVYHRHEEILVLKLIGAKDSYILRPFLYSGVLYGLMSACLAILFTQLFTLKIGMAVNQLTQAFQTQYLLSGITLVQMLSLIAFAAGLGWLGACLSVKRQLVCIEPYD